MVGGFVSPAFDGMAVMGADVGLADVGVDVGVDVGL